MQTKSQGGKRAKADKIAEHSAYEKISVRGAQENNLKNVDIDIPRGMIVAFTGKSGSGKSSLAFDTIYAEGYRKYMESLSSDARGLLSQIDKPKVRSISGLSPVIAIAQSRAGNANPRSTLATLTEIADHARLIWCFSSDQRCPKDGGKIARRTLDDCIREIIALPSDAKVHMLAPKLRQGKLADIKSALKSLKQRAWQRAMLAGEIFDLDSPSDEKSALEKLAQGVREDLFLVVDRFPMKNIARGRLADSLELAFKEGDGFVEILWTSSERTSPQKMLLSSAFSCAICGTSYKELSPRSFSFNHPDGACEVCGGIGRQMKFLPQLVVPDDSKSIKGGALKAWRIGAKNMIIRRNSLIRSLAEQTPFDLNKPWRELSEDVRNLILYGSSNRTFMFRLRRGNSRLQECFFEGVIPIMEKFVKETSSDVLRARLAAYQVSSTCEACGGGRLSSRSRNVFVENISYDKFCAMSVSEARNFSKKLLNDSKYAHMGDLVKGLFDRLEFLERVGLSYISLNRETGTLSGGEAQRARLATQLGMELTGVTYVLDEPTIGLHPSDDKLLIDALKLLKNRGNSVMLVEHDEAAILSSDWVVELGPEAGEGGGNVMFNGSIEDCKKSKTSRTGMYLTGRLGLKKPASDALSDSRFLTVKKASANNLKNIDVKFPVGLLTVVCGVSGSGKSTLVNDILAKEAAFKLNGAKEIAGAHGGVSGLENFTTVVRVDQSPIGRSPRSNPATYTKLFDLLRELYSECPLSKLRGYGAGRFSFNVKGGRCEHCGGDGFIRLDMQFLGDVFVKCPSCGGTRYNRETLEVAYKGKNIADSLNMTVSEALEFFGAHPRIVAKLSTMNDVGLGYVRLGQAANTLSGGEAQRIKLSLELSRRTKGGALYILDEPTTGLHWDDVEKLFKMLFSLRDAGNTVIIIEHQPDVIKMADWLVELGPEGGEGGGKLVFEGLVSEMKSAKTPTSKFIKW